MRTPSPYIPMASIVSGVRAYLSVSLVQPAHPLHAIAAAPLLVAAPSRMDEVVKGACSVPHNPYTFLGI